MILLGILIQATIFCIPIFKDLPLSRSDKFATISIFSILVFASFLALYSYTTDIQQVLFKNITPSWITQLINFIIFNISSLISAQILNQKFSKTDNSYYHGLLTIYKTIVPHYMITLTLYAIFSLLTAFLLQH